MRSGFIRRHAFEQRLGRHLGGALGVLAVVEVDDIRVVWQGQLGRVLDRDEALVARDFFDQAFDEGRLARAGLAADDDGLVLANARRRKSA
jgi:hypothetical protein